MSRKLRIQYPGAIYNPPSLNAQGYGRTGVMNRGDHQERIFCDDEDRQRFLLTLEEGCEKTARQVHSFCLNGESGGTSPVRAGGLRQS
jgi:hypothetical protein